MEIQASTRLRLTANMLDSELTKRLQELAKRSRTLKKGLNLAQMKNAKERALDVLKRNIKAQGLKQLQAELASGDLSNKSEAALQHAVQQALF